jgi:hypothetical protein
MYNFQFMFFRVKWRHFFSQLFFFVFHWLYFSYKWPTAYIINKHPYPTKRDKFISSLRNRAPLRSTFWLVKRARVVESCFLFYNKTHLLFPEPDLPLGRVTGCLWLICRTRSWKISLTLIFILADVSRNVLNKKDRIH